MLHCSKVPGLSNVFSIIIIVFCNDISSIFSCDLRITKVIFQVHTMTFIIVATGILAHIFFVPEIYWEWKWPSVQDHHGCIVADFWVIFFIADDQSLTLKYKQMHSSMIRPTVCRLMSNNGCGLYFFHESMRKRVVISRKLLLLSWRKSRKMNLGVTNHKKSDVNNVRYHKRKRTISCSLVTWKQLYLLLQIHKKLFWEFFFWRILL